MCLYIFTRSTVRIKNKQWLISLFMGLFCDSYYLTAHSLLHTILNVTLQNCNDDYCESLNLCLSSLALWGQMSPLCLSWCPAGAPGLLSDTRSKASLWTSLCCLKKLPDRYCDAHTTRTCRTLLLEESHFSLFHSGQKRGGWGGGKTGSVPGLAAVVQGEYWCAVTFHHS